MQRQYGDLAAPVHGIQLDWRVVVPEVEQSQSKSMSARCVGRDRAERCWCSLCVVPGLTCAMQCLILLISVCPVLEQYSSRAVALLELIGPNFKLDSGQR